MSTEYGVWSDNDGGFASAGAWSAEEAEEDRNTIINTVAADDLAEVAEDLRVRAICGDHEEQPADACEGCSTDEE